MAIAKMKEYDFKKLLHMQPCKLGHNTWLRGEPGKIREIVYHESPIIILDPDYDMVVTNTYGYTTTSTTGRIHEFLVQNAVGRCCIRKGEVVYSTIDNVERLTTPLGMCIFSFNFDW